MLFINRYLVIKGIYLYWNKLKKCIYFKKGYSDFLSFLRIILGN